MLTNSHNVDVRGFDVALVEHRRRLPRALGVGAPLEGGLEEEIFADRLQAADVNESRQLQGTDLVSSRSFPAASH